MTSFNFPAINPKKIVNGVYVLTKNNMVQVDNAVNHIQLRIDECTTGEILWVQNEFDEGEFALVGTECRSVNLRDDGVKRSDLVYVSFLQDGSSNAYSYDMKETIGNSENVIYEVVSQFEDTLTYAKSLQVLWKIKPNQERYFVGVLTENKCLERLNFFIEQLNKESVDDNDSSFNAIKAKVQNRDKSNKLKILKDFKDEKVEILGKILKVDIRVMDDKCCTMSFIHGILQF